MSAGHVSHPWRRYLRFSVRGLIVVVLLVGSWLGWIVRSARIQREAVAAINEAGGYAYYDWEWGNRGWRSGGAPNAPTWLVKQLGVDYFSRVVRVEFDEKSGSDAKLVHVGHFPALESLLLANCRNVGSYGLTHLHGLTNLSELDVSNTFVGDSGLAHLEGLRNLSTLNLAKTRITDAGMIHLRRLTELTSVDLRDDQVRSAGLAHLAGSPSPITAKTSTKATADQFVVRSGNTNVFSMLPSALMVTSFSVPRAGLNCGNRPGCVNWSRETE
jgi:internalin A